MSHRPARTLTMSLLLAVGLMLCVRATAEHSAVVSTIGQRTDANDSSTYKDGKVSYKGVSFTYDPSLSSGVKAETVPVQPMTDATEKPEGIPSDHVAFSFSDPYASRWTPASPDPPLNIYRVADFRRALAVAPNYLKALNGGIRELKAILAKRPASFRDEVVYVPFADASQSFHSHVKYVNFKNGKGIFFLTQWRQDFSIISNPLTYTFEGLTDDGRYFVLAEFPVGTSFLPAPDAAEFEGYRVPDYPGKNYEKNRRQYKTYAAKVARRLEATSPDRFEPRLTSLEEMIRSLDVR